MTMVDFALECSPYVATYRVCEQIDYSLSTISIEGPRNLSTVLLFILTLLGVAFGT